MNYPLISIIVPVYQVEKYLEKCINSIIVQTYKNLEIILVDDGSTDNCPAICDRFQSEDSRIKVIHQENGGLSHARNVGLEHATGDFIGFVDSDDWIEPNMYEVLMSALQETGADIAVCSRQHDSEDSMPTKNDIIFPPKKLYSPKEALKKIISGGHFIRNTVWNKLYKRSIISNIHFPERKIYEDILWMPQVISQSKLLVCMDYPLYHYHPRPESLCHNDAQLIKKIHDKIEMIEQRTEYISKHYPILRNFAILKLKNAYCNEYIRISITNHQQDTNDEIQHELQRKFLQCKPDNIFVFDGVITAFERIIFRISPILLVNTYIFLQKTIQRVWKKNSLITT